MVIPELCNTVSKDNNKKIVTIFYPRFFFGKTAITEPLR